MKNVQRGLAAAALAIALSGCAASPESIKPTYVSTAQYSYLNCAQLADFKVTLTTAYKKAADSEDDARMLDAATIVVAPIGSMTHQSLPYQISDLKGRIAAVDRLEAQNSCHLQRQVAAQ